MTTNDNSIDVEGILESLDNKMIAYDAVEEGLDILEEGFESGLSGCQTGIFISSESGTGKSTLVRTFSRRYPPVRTDDGVIIKVLTVMLDSEPTTKALYMEILDKLGDPYPTRGTIKEMEMRIVHLIRECETIMLIIDEIQHLIDHYVGTRPIYKVTDALKNLIQKTNIVPVFSGLDSGRILMRKNTQIRRRVTQVIQMPRFDWQDHDLREQFLGVLEALEDIYREHFTIPDLCSEEMAYRMFLASGGLIDYLTKILKTGAHKAMRQGSLTLTVDDIEAGYKAVVSSEDKHAISPFSNKFSLLDQNHYHHALLIGSAGEGEMPENSRYKKASKAAYKPKTLSQALTSLGAPSHVE